MPGPSGRAIVALVAAASAEPLGPFILAVGAALHFEWGPVEADLVQQDGTRVRVSTTLRIALADALRRATSAEDRHLVALRALEEIAQRIGDALRAAAQSELASLPADAQRAALVAPSPAEVDGRHAAAARAVAAGARALATPEGEGVTPSGR
jgi:hypothetical protein